MNVSLTQELEELVESKVSSGKYKSVSEVVREGLRLLSERDSWIALKQDAIRAQIAEGVGQLDAGLGIDGEQAVAEIREEIHAFKRRRK